MRIPPEYWPASGELIAVPKLRLEKAVRLVKYLQDYGEEVFATLVETRFLKAAGAEVVVFDVEVERPQVLVHDVKRVERVQAVFTDEPDKAPEVSLLRKSFPSVPHTNLTLANTARQICLYEQGWDEVRLKWTVAEFLARVRFWLAKTATGTLHADDQPLEPLIIHSAAKLILPSDFSVTKVDAEQGMIDISKISANGAEIVLVADWKTGPQKRPAHSVAAIFECAPQQHGVIKHQPQNLLELHELCIAAGLDLVQQLTAKIQNWHKEKPDPHILKAQLIIIVLLPKTRTGTVIEGMDVCAFITAKSVQEVGHSLGAIVTSGGHAAYILDIKLDPEAIKKVGVGMIQLHNLISPADAARLNGIEPKSHRITAIGVGALGSQIFNNLIRAGYGVWTLLDIDILLPHNCARHFLGSWAVGHNKAEAMAQVANEILDGPDIARGVRVDVLHPKEQIEELTKVMGEADVIMDFSASVAVTRFLSASQHKARHVAAFLTPSGNCLVVAGEDGKRDIRLDWLEMLHYRCVINMPELRGTMSTQLSQVRYGNACRDLSSRTSQDDVAIGAAIGSKSIKQLVDKADAFLRIYVWNEDGETRLIEEAITPVTSVQVGPWKIRFDRALLTKLQQHRLAKLPNETGGVLVGHFDTFHHVCSIVDFIPSPPDSVEWPISYIRGCEGLKDEIEKLKASTLGQLQYVGEWHSHPDGSSTNPSSDDFKAYSWLIEQMCKDELPALMLIVGENDDFQFVAATPGSFYG